MIIPYILVASSYSFITGIEHIYFKKNNLNNTDKLSCLFMKIGMSPICFPVYMYNDINYNVDMIKYKNYMDYILGK